jgi:hypothetical protein
MRRIDDRRNTRPNASPQAAGAPAAAAAREWSSTARAAVRFTAGYSLRLCGLAFPNQHRAEP